jgi:hypothetical protein
MIVYIASYPRSGNLWVRSLISNQFKKLTTTIHGKFREGIAEKKWVHGESVLYGVFIQTEGLVKDLPLDGPMALKGRIASYDFEDGRQLSQRTLIPGFVDIFTEEVRRYLSDDEEYFFVKTHFSPPQTIFPGEYFVQVIRHPGASLWSYYKFLHELQDKKDVTVASVLRGNHGFGDWSAYHHNFNIVVPKLNGRFLRIRYEDLAENESAVCERLEGFLGLPILDNYYRPFEHYNKHRPNLARSGKAFGWEENFSLSELELLEELHGERMRELGYHTSHLSGA